MPILEEGNVEIWKVFEILHTQARIAGLGSFVSFDYGPLSMIFKAMSIPESEWIFALEKLNAITNVALKYWTSEKKE